VPYFGRLNIAIRKKPSRPPSEKREKFLPPSGGKVDLDPPPLEMIEKRPSRTRLIIAQPYLEILKWK